MTSTMTIIKVLILATALAPIAAMAEVSWRVGGNDKDLANALRSASQVQRIFGESGPREVLSAALSDYSTLLDVLFSEGYLSPEISIRLDGREAGQISLLTPPSKINRVDYRILLGPLFRFGRVSIEPLATGSPLPQDLKAGQPAQLSLVVAALDSAVSGWRQNGFAKARITQQSLVVDHKSGLLNVDASVEPGPLVRFGDLRIENESKVRSARIRKIASLPKGAVFSPSILANVTERLRSSGAFSSIQLREAENLSANGEMDIIAELVDEKPRRVGVGAELSSSEGATLSAFWFHRNAFGGAERLRFDAEVSEIGSPSSKTDYSIGATLEVPAIIDADTTGIFATEYSWEDEPDYRTELLGFSAGLSRRFSEHLVGSIAIELEIAESEDFLGSRRFTTISVPTQATFDHRDNKLDPASGWYLNATATPYVSLDGDPALIRTTMDARAYQKPSASSNVVFAERFQLGNVAGAGLSDVRPDLLFHSGGGSTVRGQSFQSLGVDLGLGDETGGRTFVGVSLEARIPVNQTWGLVGFVDSGYVGSESFFDGSGAWHHGGGLGIRYKTPVGPIRADLGVPIGNTRSGSYFVYLGIGQSY